MCGIAGIISSNLPIDKPVLESMAGSLRHRGPDANGIYISKNGNVGLAHTRLSVIDLSSEANQPFYSGNGRYVIVFNGEIYNYIALREELRKTYGISFRTNSDTEVLLEAFGVWGTKMAERLEGMFALAIEDQHENKLFLLRDRIGKKPLYYFHSSSLFVFASEIKSLLKHPAIGRDKQINRKCINSFLHLGYIPEPHTAFAGIYKFPAGHTGEIGIDMKLKIQPYWQVTDKVHNIRIRQEREALPRLNELVNAAVQKRLISDVPLGAFLSGGTDSSLVVAVASRHVPVPLKTFSIGFKDSRFDESRYAAEVSQYLKTDHTEYILSEREAMDILETYLSHFDEPFADTSAIPTMLVSQLARQEVKVVLTGDGGDELFLGYGAYTWAGRLNRLLWKMLQVPASLLFHASGKSRWRRIARLLEAASVGGIRSHIFSQEQYLFTQQEVKERLLVNSDDFLEFSYDDPDNLPAEISAEERQALFDLQFYLRDDLLVKVDRASMYYALECRCPLLDHHIIEYAFSLHSSLKRRHSISKWILKELLHQYVPREIVDRPKWGFSVPLARWLKQNMRYLVEEFLSEEAIEQIGVFNSDYIQQLKKEFFAGQEYLYNRLWAIIVLHKWWKENL